MKKIIIITIFISFLSIPVYAEKNWCHDPKTWDDWNAMVKKHPEDVPLQILHALRIGLCVKIENGSIAFDEATDLMNNMMNSLIEKRAEKGDAEKNELQ